MSPSRTIECAQNEFRARHTFDANRAPILHRDSHYLQTNVRQKGFHARGTLGANYAPILRRN
jgi:hypothetical protein